MTLPVVWSVQARNQFVATLTYIAKEDPLSAELVQELAVVLCQALVLQCLHGLQEAVRLFQRPSGVF